MKFNSNWISRNLTTYPDRVANSVWFFCIADMLCPHLLPIHGLRVSSKLFRIAPSYARTLSSTPLIPLKVLQQLDQKNPLANSVYDYSRHFSISTGEYNWPAAIKEDIHYGPSSRNIGGKASPFHLSQFVVDWATVLKPNRHVMFTKSSHISSHPCIHVYPDNIKVTFNSEFPSLDEIREFQSSWILSSSKESLGFITVEELPRNTVHIYVCCHAARDQRCGVIGNLLISTMRDYLKTPPADLAAPLGSMDIQIFGCSHMGGHKFAGNMVIYRPVWKQGIWYGRILPNNVDEIMRETVLDGKILGKHWRGGLPDGSWDPKEHISGGEAEKRAMKWRCDIYRGC
jgi:hypothetical protein